jgi:hypothetical protein
LFHVKTPREKQPARSETEAKKLIQEDSIHNFFDYEKYDCERLWPVYNVLMVLWDSGKAVRLGGHYS